MIKAVISLFPVHTCQGSLREQGGFGKTHTAVSEWDKRKLPALSKTPSAFSFTILSICHLSHLLSAWCHGNKGKWRLPSFLEWKMSPMGSCIWTLGPLGVELFEDLIESLGGRALTEEVCHWGRLWGYMDSSHFLFFLSFLYMDGNVSIQLPAPTAVPYLPCHDGVFPSHAIIQNK